MLMYSFITAVPQAFHRTSARCCAETSTDDYKVPPPPPAAKKRLRGRVAYDGTNYNGWQFQINGRTVQGAIEHVIERRFGRLIRVVGASRTDSGVHAHGQAFHIDIPEDIAPVCSVDEFQRLEYIINQMLPTDIRVTHLDEAPMYTTYTHIPAPSSSDCDGATMLERQHVWSALYDATSKLYSYRFSTAKALDPLLRLYCHHEWRAAKFGFCEMRMREAIKQFEGSHDFSAFANSTPKALVKSNPVRTISSIIVVRESEDRYRLEYILDGALYKMVRNVTGTILDVACFQRDADCVDELFKSRNRRKVSKSAPANGLCLEQVFYDDWPM